MSGDSDTRDIRGMGLAIESAHQALLDGQQPFGAAILDREGRLVASAHGTHTTAEPLRHSEMLVICEAADLLGKLRYCTLYSTHEPCVMCCGAIGHAKLGRVVFGSYRMDFPNLFRQKIPARILLTMTDNPPTLREGFMREECKALLVSRTRWVGA